MKSELIDVNPMGIKAFKIKHLKTNRLIASFHFHELCELVWIEKSHGKRIVGDHIGNFEDNDLVLMGPDLPHIWQSHNILSSEDNEVAKSTVIYFPSDFILGLTDDQNILNLIEDLIKKAGRGLKFYGKTNQEVTLILKKLPQQKGIDKIISFLRVIDILSSSHEYEYLATIGFKNPYNEKDTNRINKVYQFLMKNFKRDINLKEVAELCNMTTNSFCRFFKDRSQKSLTQFINEIRIGHACKLLQNPEYSIAEVCYSSGYNNLTNFNKFFKQITGMSPSHYRMHLK
ncbi:AraC family transcriptional regulator [Pedobacter sp. HMWF019]|uniref:AraC family transcriptional regulator n=1 Tax=Pedobacter sp. HMWF019 TaxID=2056856 RepID=UPI000D379A1D|nr:AraC family transcriptional regulator [Pedobacter sp. HMWF019]PTS98499.1 AraC family transcriptional regulator [Pedobacter sp. HMWF019]